MPLRWGGLGWALQGRVPWTGSACEALTHVFMSVMECGVWCVLCHGPGLALDLATASQVVMQ